jgi:hypothetical protein
LSLYSSNLFLTYLLTRDCLRHVPFVRLARGVLHSGLTLWLSLVTGKGIILFFLLSLDQDRRCLLEHTVGGVAFRFLFRLASLHPILAFVLSRSISRFISCAFQLYFLIFPSIFKGSDSSLLVHTDHCLLHWSLIGRHLKRWGYFSNSNLQSLILLICMQSILETLPTQWSCML